MIQIQKKIKNIYETYTEILRWNSLCYGFDDSQKKSDTKILKIHVKKWFTYFFYKNYIYKPHNCQ